MLRLLVLVVLGAFLAGASGAEPVFASTSNPKLSSVLAGGDVSGFLIAPDGQTVVFLARLEPDDVRELYSVPIDGSSAAVKISGPMGDDGVVYYEISPDGSRVVYRANDEHSELYSVPIDGSATPTKLNLTSCSIDGNLCETVADCPAVGHCLAGGQLCETNPDCPGALNACRDLETQICAGLGDISSLAINSTSTYVVYRADEETEEVFELFVVPIDGSSAAQKLSGPMVAGGDVILYAISPDGNRVLYRADQETDEVRELFSAPIDGSSTAVKLNGDLVPGGSVDYHLLFSPDSTKVVYSADQETEGVHEIYVVPADGSAPAVKLVASTGWGAEVQRVTNDGTRVVYWVYLTATDCELYSVPIDGSSSPTKISHPALEYIHVPLAFGQGIPWLAYQAHVSGGFHQIFGTSDDGSAGPVLLQSPTDNLWPDMLVRGGRLLYIAVGDPPPSRVFSVPLDGSQPLTQLNTGDLYTWDWHSGIGPDVLAYQEEVKPYFVEAYAVAVAGNLPPFKVNGSLTPGGSVQWVRVNSLATWAVYVADQDTDGTIELYGRQLDLDADGTPDETDNCPRVPNPGQGAVVFGQEVLATGKIAFSWAVTADVNYVRGVLDSVGSYATDESGSLTDVITHTDAVEPAAGTGFYYLFKPGGGCAVGSWQTTAAAQPARDASLP